MYRANLLSSSTLFCLNQDMIIIKFRNSASFVTISNSLSEAPFGNFCDDRLLCSQCAVLKRGWIRLQLVLSAWRQWKGDGHCYFEKEKQIKKHEQKVLLKCNISVSFQNPKPRHQMRAQNVSLRLWVVRANKSKQKSFG